MAANAKDYYEILGVKRTASAEDDSQGFSQACPQTSS